MNILNFLENPEIMYYYLSFSHTVPDMLITAVYVFHFFS